MDAEVEYPAEAEDLLVEFETLIQKIAEGVSIEAAEPTLQAARDHWKKLDSFLEQIKNERLESRQLFKQAADDFREGSLKTVTNQTKLLNDIVTGFEKKQSAAVNNLKEAGNHFEKCFDKAAENHSQKHDTHISQIEETNKNLKVVLERITEKHEKLAERYDSLADARRRELNKTIGFMKEVKEASTQARSSFRKFFWLFFLMQTATLVLLFKFLQIAILG